MRRLLVERVLPLEGPPTSVGGVHLGPAYYYVLALPMLVDWLSPLAAAVFMAMLGAVTVGIVFYLAQRWFGFWPAACAAGLYALSPAAIVAARSAWNPAPAPLFTMLTVLGLDAAWRTGKGVWLLLVGLALGVLIQLHYFALAIVVFSWLIVALLVARKPALTSWALGGLAGFLLLLTPLAIHELRSDFPNLRAAFALASADSARTVQISAPRRAYEVFALGLVGTFVATNVEALAVVVSAGVLIALGLGVGREPARILLNSLIAGLLLVTVAQALVYRGTIFEHYLLAISPVLFLGIAALLATIPRTHLAAVAAGIAVMTLAGLNLANSPLREPPLNQLAHTRSVAQLIADATQDQPFELWLLAGGESDGAYRFWLEGMGRSPLPADAAQGPQLVIICRRTICDPAHAQDQAGVAWSSAHVAWGSTVGDDEILLLVL